VKAVPLPEDVLFATRAFDGRDDFDAVDDDSDDEEDTRRYKLFKESGRVGDNEEDRRSEAPEPAQQNGDGKEASRAGSIADHLNHPLTCLRCSSLQRKSQNRIRTKKTQMKNIPTQRTRIKRWLKLLLYQCGRLS